MVYSSVGVVGAVTVVVCVVLANKHLKAKQVHAPEYIPIEPDLPPAPTFTPLTREEEFRYQGWKDKDMQWLLGQTRI